MSPICRHEKTGRSRFFFRSMTTVSGGGGHVQCWLRRARVRLVQDLQRLAGTAAAAGRHAETLAKLVEVADPPSRGAANLFVGHGVADADIHKFNDLAKLRLFKRK